MVEVVYKDYSSPEQIDAIENLIKNDLSEPYSIYTYWYFVKQWPDLCKLAYIGDQLVGVAICKYSTLNFDKKGYIAMLGVSEKYRNLGIGTELVKLSLKRMKQLGISSASLESDENNHKALSLYKKMGFYRSNYHHRYYFNGASAFSLKLNLLNDPNKILCTEDTQVKDYDLM